MQSSGHGEFLNFPVQSTLQVPVIPSVRIVVALPIKTMAEKRLSRPMIVMIPLVREKISIENCDGVGGCL